jgi:hypothetical protein
MVMTPCRLSAVVLMRRTPQVKMMGVMSATVSSSAVCVVIDTGATPGPSNCRVFAKLARVIRSLWTDALQPLLMNRYILQPLLLQAGYLV